jgi:hypothetical protein
MPWLKDNCPELLAAMTRKLGHNGVLLRDDLESFLADQLDDGQHARRIVDSFVAGDIFDAAMTHRIRFKPGIAIMLGHFHKVQNPFAKPFAAEQGRRTGNEVVALTNGTGARSNGTGAHGNGVGAHHNGGTALVPVETAETKQDRKIVSEFVTAAREFRGEGIDRATEIAQPRLREYGIAVSRQAIIKVVADAGYLKNGAINFSLDTGKLFAESAKTAVKRMQPARSVDHSDQPLADPSSVTTGPS